MSDKRNARICENGHVVASDVKVSEHGDAKFCGDCGAATLTTCRSCSEPIVGMAPVDAMATKWRPTDFCTACGKPYPWAGKSGAGRAEINLIGSKRS